MAAEKFIPISLQLNLRGDKQAVSQLRAQINSLATDGAQLGNKLRDSLKNTFGGGNFGGNLKNQLSESIAGLSAFGAKAAGVAGVVAGAGLAIGKMTLDLARNANELRTLSAVTGVNVEKLQQYQNAAQVTGTSLSTLTEGVNKYRQRAVEATRGNKEVEASFKLLGISARDAANNPQQSFEKLLDQLQRFPNDVSKANAITRVFGEGNLELSRTMLSLTANNGELRKQLQATGVVMSAQSVNELAQINRSYELLILRVETFAKRSLVQLVNSLNTAKQRISQSGILELGRQAIFDPVAFSKGFVEPVTGNGNGKNSSSVSGSSPSLQSLGYGARADALAGNKKKNLGGLPGGGGRASAKALTEAEQLAAQLKDLNRDIAYLSDATSKEYKLRFQIEGAREKRAELEELLKLRNELGVPGNLNQLRGLAEYNKLSQKRPEIAVTTPEFIKKDIEARTKAAEKEKDIADLLAETAETLRERLEDIGAGGDGRSNELSVRRQLRKAGASGEKADEVIALAAAADRETEARQRNIDALEEGRRKLENLRGTLQGLFDSLLEGPKSFFQSLKQIGKRILSDGLTNVLTRGNSQGGAKGLLNTFFGGGSEGGGPLSSLFRTRGINPAAATPGVSGGGGLSALGNFAGLAGGLKGIGGAAVGGLSKLPLIGGLIGKLGGGISIGVSGGASAAGGGAAAAGGAGSLLGGLAPLLTNPITGIVAGAAIAGFFLYKKFSNRDLKSLRKLINQQYGVDIKDNNILKQIREIGKKTFGKQYNSRLSEVVALPEVKDIVTQYQEENGLEGNGKLQSKATLSNPYSAPNYFTRGGSEFQPSIRPDAAGGGGTAPGGSSGGGLSGVIARLNETVSKLTSMPPGALVREGLPSNNDLIADGVRREQRRDQQFGTGFLADNGF